GGFNMRQEPLEMRLGDNPDPSLLFSSVTHGDPATPLLRAYAGDLAVIRLVNPSGHDAATFRLMGHPFRIERFEPRATPRDTVLISLSERWDFFFTAGGGTGQAGDYLYMNAMNEKTMDGAWGILRVHDSLQPDLQPLLARPPSAPGFPQNLETGGRPPPAADAGDIVPAGTPVRTFDVVAIEVDIEFSKDYHIGDGRVYVLAGDEAAVLAGTKPLEPLVLRANAGEAVRIRFTNHLTTARASFHIPQLAQTTDSQGAAVGFNNDSTVSPGGAIIQWYVIAEDEPPRSFTITDLGDPVDGAASGLYGLFIIEPAGSSYHDPETGAEVRSGTVVDVRNPSFPGGGFRDVALLFHDDDHIMNRDVMPYRIEVRGVRGINYRAEPFLERLAQDAAISRIFRTGASHADPTTAVIEAVAGDPILLHVAGAYGNHPHVFTIDGHRFPFEPARPEAMHLYARQFGTGSTIDAFLEGGAGGRFGFPGDYLFGDGRNPFLEGGLWGILRVSPRSHAASLPLGMMHPGWNLVSRNVVPDETGIAQFLASIGGRFDLVAAAVPGDPEDLLTFQPDATANTLTDLNHTRGFWVRMTEPGFLSPSGRLPDQTSMPLTAGWNLVGWPSRLTLPVEEALASLDGSYDLVFAYHADDSQDPWKRYDPAAAFGNDLLLVEPLHGYWIHLTEPGTLNVPGR
ncbi:MAG: hypothetical protein V3S10_00780, partial [Dehalococcoidales bacterium]